MPRGVYDRTKIKFVPKPKDPAQIAREEAQEVALIAKVRQREETVAFIKYALAELDEVRARVLNYGLERLGQ